VSTPVLFLGKSSQPLPAGAESTEDFGLLDPPKPGILIVDDEPAMRELICEALRPHASKIMTADDAQQASVHISGGGFDVVLCDMYMPGMNGLELLARARASNWDVAFILLTGRPDVEPVVRALRLEASDFLVKPVSLSVLHETVNRSYRRLLLHRAARNYRTQLEASIQHRTRELAAALGQLEENFEATLEALVAALDAREHETYSHSFRVRAYTMYLARLAGYPLEMMPQLEHAALLHDIGKIAVSDAILLKAGPLTPEEWKEMRKHPVVGESILNRVSFLRPAARIVRHHHERWDGTGYPGRLFAEQIPLGARLFAVADTLDAMTSDRLYRKALPHEVARDEIARCSGSQFDPKLVSLFLSAPDDDWFALRNEVDSTHPVRCSQ
jgi:putative nucleotidyltransferase with HDIG domain